MVQLVSPSRCSQDERAEMMEDPSAEYHLYWKQPPSTMFVVKKIGDPEVTKKFVEVAKWLIEVSLVHIWDRWEGDSERWEGDSVRAAGDSEG